MRTLLAFIFGFILLGAGLTLLKPDQSFRTYPEVLKELVEDAPLKTYRNDFYGYTVRYPELLRVRDNGPYIPNSSPTKRGRKIREKDSPGSPTTIRPTWSLNVMYRQKTKSFRPRVKWKKWPAVSVQRNRWP